jgi:hypothetical protein
MFVSRIRTNEKQNRRPLWLGALLAATVAASCVMIPFVEALPNLDFAGAALLFAYSFAVALVAMLGFGLPYVFLLRARYWLSMLSVCMGAAVIGAFTVALFNWAVSWNHRGPGLIELGYGAGLGLAAGAGFCLGAGVGTRVLR